jgi:signal peptidase I
MRVSGDSLAPIYRDGDFVLLSKVPISFGKISPGDVVVFSHPEYGTMIKMVEKIQTKSNDLILVGTRETSIDSTWFGPIPYKEVMGKVIWHIRKRK